MDDPHLSTREKAVSCSCDCLSHQQDAARIADLEACTEELRMGHVRIDECSGAEETEGRPLYDRISWVLQRAENRRAELAIRVEREYERGVIAGEKVISDERYEMRALLASHAETIRQLTQDNEDLKTRVAPLDAGVEGRDLPQSSNEPSPSL